MTMKPKTMRLSALRTPSRYYILLLLIVISACSSVDCFSPPLQPSRRRIEGGASRLKVSSLHDFNAASPKRKISVKKQQQQFLRDVVVIGSQASTTLGAYGVTRAPQQQHSSPRIWGVTTPFISVPSAPLLPSPNNRQVVVTDVAEMAVGLLLVLVATHWTLTFLEPAVGSDLTCAARWAAINGFFVTLAVRVPHRHHQAPEES
jgi:hypothetical protein